MDTFINLIFIVLQTIIHQIIIFILYYYRQKISVVPLYSVMGGFFFAIGILGPLKIFFLLPGSTEISYIEIVASAPILSIALLFYIVEGIEEVKKIINSFIIIFLIMFLSTSILLKIQGNLYFNNMIISQNESFSNYFLLLWDFSGRYLVILIANIFIINVVYQFLSNKFKLPEFIKVLITFSAIIYLNFFIMNISAILSKDYSAKRLILIFIENLVFIAIISATITIFLSILRKTSDKIKDIRGRNIFSIVLSYLPNSIYKMQLSEKVEELKKSQQVMKTKNIELEVLINELKDKNLELKNQKMISEENMRLKNEFLASVSHELRTPLNVIIGFAEIFLQTIPDKLEKSEIQGIEKIYENGKHLLKLINDVLDFSKIESGKIEVDIKKIEINELYTSIMNFEKNSNFKKDKITFECDISEDLKYFYSDNVKVIQIISNLLSNSFKFTNEGFVKLSIKKKAPSNIIVFTIEDSGIGIDKTYFTEIFERFKQIDSSYTKKYGGFGIGLAIVKELVHIIGGDIFIESKVTQGTKIIVEIPDFNAYFFAKYKVALLFGIDKSDIIMFKTISENKKFKYIISSDVDMAIDKIIKYNLSLIVIDIENKDADGNIIIEKLKQKQAIKSFPVLGIIPSFYKTNKNFDKDKGFNTHIRRPLTRIKLIRKIRHLVPGVFGKD